MATNFDALKICYGVDTPDKTIEAQLLPPEVSGSVWSAVVTQFRDASTSDTTRHRIISTIIAMAAKLNVQDVVELFSDERFLNKIKLEVPPNSALRDMQTVYVRIILRPADGSTFILLLINVSYAFGIIHS